MELVILLVLGVLLMGAVGFFIALSHGGKITALNRRVQALESELAFLQRSRRDAQTAQPAPEPAPPAAPEPVREEVLPPVTLPPIVETPAFEEPPPVAALPPSPAPEEIAASEAPPVEPVAEAAAPRKTDWEARIGKRWLTWGGVILLVAAAGFLVKYAYDQGWIGPWTQIAIGIAAGCGLCVLGDWQVRARNMRPLGQGVMSLGLTLVYLTCFGAYAHFRLAAVSQMTALGLLAATSAAGILLSNRHRSMPVCILAAVGGYLAPVLVSTGRPPPVNGFFTYTVLVNLGVIVVSMLRTWPAMPLLVFAGTIVHFGGWHMEFYRPELGATVGIWAAIFHFVFLVLPALPLLRGRRQTPWQWLLPVANAVLGVYVIWIHLRTDHPLALMLTLAATAAAHIAPGLKTRKLEANAVLRELYSVLGLAILTLAPLAWFGVQANLVCWLALGLLLVGLGCRLGFRPYLGFGCLNLLLGAGWCVARLWTDCGAHSNWEEFALLGLGYASRTVGAQDSLFSLPHFWTRLLVPVAWGGCALIFHRRREKDARRFLVPKIVAGVGAVLLALIFISNDVNPWMTLGTRAEDPRFALGYGLGPLWCLGMAGVALAGWWWKVPAVSWLGVVFFVPSAVLIARLYFHDSLPDSGYFRNAAYFAKLFFSLCCMVAAWTVGGPRRALCAGIAGYLLILTQHSEVHSWGRPATYALASGIALLYNAAALACAVLHWRFRSRDLRIGMLPAVVMAVIFESVAFSLRARSGAAPTLFLNLFFVNGLLLVLSLFLTALRSRGAWSMYVLAAVSGFLLLSFECYQWCVLAWGDGAAGKRAAVMSLSIVWGFYSIFLLITGFATRIRGWRLSGLILFGVTCLKLVIVDLARLEQLHRILSFMAVGLLLMAASYLYHKLEKQLEEKSD